MKATIAIIGVLMIIGPSTEWVFSDEHEIKPSPTGKVIWIDDIGSGFRKGLYQVGATVGAGFGVEVFGGTLAHDTIWRGRQRMLAGYLRT